MSTEADRVKAAIALGIAIGPSEVATLQRAHNDGPLTALVVDDPRQASVDSDLAPELRRFFAESSDQQLAAAAGLHPSSSDQLIARTLARHDVQVLISSAPARLPEHVRTVLAERGNSHERRAAARSATEADLLDRLAHDDDRQVRIAVAANATTDPATLASLATDREPSVRAAAARRSDLPSGALARLGADEDTIVRVNAASNRATPPTTLEALAQDPATKCRRAVATNTATPVSVMRLLATDGDDAVRARVAASRSASSDLLAALARDDSPDVRRQVARNPLLVDPAIFAALHSNVPDHAIASNPSAPQSLLDEIAERHLHAADGDCDETAVVALARNPGCSTDALADIAEWLTGPSEPGHRNNRRGAARALAANPSTPIDLIRRLASHADASTRRRADRQLADRAGL